MPSWLFVLIHDDLVLAKSIEIVRLRDILNALKLEQGESLEGIGLYGEVSQMESAQETDQIQELLEKTEETWAEHASNLTLQKLCDRLSDPMESADASPLRLTEGGRKTRVPTLAKPRQCMSIPPLSIAPMLDRTDRHYRYFMRLITKHTLLYTEMVTCQSIVHGNRERLLGYDAVEHPVSLQLGGG